MSENVPVVILAGGKGTRMRDFSARIPKAIVPIGKMAVIEHVMRIYSYHGFNDFVIALGYKGDSIKQYFQREESEKEFSLQIEDAVLHYSPLEKDRFNIDFVDTGLETESGGRIKKLENVIKSDTFFMTYCDGVSDVNIKDLLAFHKNKGKIATLTAVHAINPFGVVTIKDGIVGSFKEKPTLPGYINGGFFVFNRKIFDYLDENSVLEREPLQELAKSGQLAAYQHDGFWASMDTHKDVDRLNKVWETGIFPDTGMNFGKAPWKVWED